MSSPPASIESGATQPDWNALEELLDELADLAQSPLAPVEFYRRLVDRLLPALAVPAAAIWTCPNPDELRLEYQANLAANPAALGAALAIHQTAVEHTLASGEAAVLPADEGNQTLICQPFGLGTATSGVIELVSRNSLTAGAGRQYLRALTAVAELLNDFHRHSELEQLRGQQRAWRQYDRLAQTVHRNLDLRRTAFAIANDGRQAIDCDRVSVLVSRGGRCRAVSISGVDVLDRRAKVVRLLEQLATRAVAAGEPIWFHDQVADLPPQVETVLNAYLDETHARGVALVPLHAPQNQPNQLRGVVGMLVVEWFHAGAGDAEARERTALVARHGESALNNALVHSRLPLSSVGRQLAKLRPAVADRGWFKTTLLASALVATVAALCLVPVNFDIEAVGELEPARRREVFASESGMVSELLVDHAQAVRAGEPLVQLRKPELDLNLRRVAGEIQTAEKRLAAIQAERLDNVPNRPDSTRRNSHQLTADEEELKEQLKGLREQREILTREREELLVRSPIDGETLTWNLKQQLEARPVERGQILFTVGDLSGPWMLELHISDRQVGHVLAARERLEPNLPVSFILAAEPGTVYQGQLTEMAASTSLDEERGATVLAKVAFDRDEVATLRPGATVTARIHCGRRAVGYVWLHDLFELVQSRWWW